MKQVQWFFHVQGRDRRVAQMPLILCVDSRSEDSNITLLGIPPLHGDDDRKWVTNFVSMKF